MTGHAVRLALLFLGVLALALLLFYAQNQRLHDQAQEAERIACLKDRQIATNQRRVIRAILELEQREAEHGQLKADGHLLRAALARVPQFNCK